MEGKIRLVGGAIGAVARRARADGDRGGVKSHGDRGRLQSGETNVRYSSQIHRQLLSREAS